MYWVYFILAILFEVAGTTCMKFSMGFTRLYPSILVFIFYVLSLSFLTLALKKMDIGIAYAVWSGLGTVLIAVIGFVYFAESINGLKIISIILIILGVVGLNIAGLKH